MAVERRLGRPRDAVARDGLPAHGAPAHRPPEDRDRPVSSGQANAPAPPYEVVVVAYRSRDQVAGLLEQLPADQPVAVVDNSGDVDGTSAVVAGRPSARYVPGPGRGFARAANLAARTSRHDYVVFCNPDTRPTPAVLGELVAELARDPRCASCSALPVGDDGRPQLGAAGWEPTLRRTAVHALGLHRLWPRSGLVARPSPHHDIEAEWLTGACLAVRRATFLELGGFDEAYFVYSEDVALGRAIRERGLRQVMRTDLPVPHSRGGSGAPALEMDRLKGASMAWYLGRHNSRPRAAAMRALLLVGYGLRIAERLVLGDTRTARLHVAYTRGLVTGRARAGGVEVTRP